MGAKVKDTVTSDGKKFERMLRELSKLEVRVGFQAGKATEADGTDICSIAAWNELGTTNIPPRPFLRMSVDENTDKISGFIRSLKSDLVKPGMTAEQILKKIGVFQKGLIQETIGSGSFEPNKPSTIRKKGSSTPLIDSGTMRQSVNFEIKERGGD